MLHNGKLRGSFEKIRK